MATTQVQSMNATEVAENAFNQAQKAAESAGNKLEFYSGQRRALEQQVAELQSKYNAACKAFAGGDGTDPGPARDELARAESRLNGTIQLHEEWDKIAQPLAAKLQKAGLQLAWQKESDALSDLLKAETAAKDAAMAAVRKADEGTRLHGQAVYELGQGRRRLAAIEAELKTL